MKIVIELDSLDEIPELKRFLSRFDTPQNGRDAAPLTDAAEWPPKRKRRRPAVHSNGDQVPAPAYQRPHPPLP